MLLLIAIFFFCSPNLGFAECTELGRMNRWVVQGDGTVNFYSQNVLLARAQLRCSVYPSSNISLLKSLVCDRNDVLVDGQKRMVVTLTVGE